MKRILKYELKVSYLESQQLHLLLHGHPKMLSVQVLDNIPYLYCLVTPGLPLLAHYFTINGTGVEMGDATGNYIGTFVVQQLYLKDATPKPVRAKRNFVGHVFITRREMGQKGEE